MEAKGSKEFDKDQVRRFLEYGCSFDGCTDIVNDLIVYKPRKLIFHKSLRNLIANSIIP